MASPFDCVRRRPRAAAAARRRGAVAGADPPPPPAPPVRSAAPPRSPESLAIGPLPGVAALIIILALALGIVCCCAVFVWCVLCAGKQAKTTGPASSSSLPRGGAAVVRAANKDDLRLNLGKAGGTQLERRNTTPPQFTDLRSLGAARRPRPGGARAQAELLLSAGIHD